MSEVREANVMEIEGEDAECRIGVDVLAKAAAHTRQNRPQA